MKILADASLPGLEAAFPKPFVLETYRQPEELTVLLKDQDILLCRSTLKVDAQLLKDQNLRYLATASSGLDHLDLQFLKESGIQVFDAKGANAVSVADYVLACLAYLDKNQFIKGRKAGIIGMGIVGTAVQQRLSALGFKLQRYDPPKMQREPSFQSCELEALFDVDLLCIHAALEKTGPFASVNLIDEAFLSQIKPTCLIINAARGGIVKEEALLKAETKIPYCTDVYLNEPQINAALVNQALLCTPHIAGHSLEAKWRAVHYVSQKLHQELQLPLPLYAYPPQAEYSDSTQYQSWHDLILSLYNPMEETLKLKAATDKTKAFLNLREAHQKRHDFLSILSS